MQKCKYLDDLGLKIEEYGTNFTYDDDPREGRRFINENISCGI